jgi:AAA15 family ATPase/GTPase
LLKDDPKKQVYLENIIKKYGFFDNFDKITENYIFLNETPYPINDFGDGFKQFLRICLLSEDKEILLLDEPTSFMHPGYIYSFVDYIYNISKEKQIFITTHDIDLIEEILNLYRYRNFDDILLLEL